MSKTHRVAWAAGFFDGEGYITIQERNKTAPNGKKYLSHAIYIGINHVAKEPLTEIYDLFGGWLVYTEATAQKDGCNRKGRWEWRINGPRVNEILKQLMPFLKNKNRAAEIAFDFLATYPEKKTTSVTDETKQLRSSLRNRLKEINSLD